MISVCFLFSKIPLPRRGSYPSIVIPTGAKHRVQSPLERWPPTISTDRPEMESSPMNSFFRAQALGCVGFSICDTRFQLPLGVWNPTQPGTEPVSSALAGRFPTTRPPRRSLISFYLQKLKDCCSAILPVTSEIIALVRF